MVFVGILTDAWKVEPPPCCVPVNGEAVAVFPANEYVAVPKSDVDEVVTKPEVSGITRVYFAVGP